MKKATLYQSVFGYYCIEFEYVAKGTKKTQRNRIPQKDILAGRNNLVKAAGRGYIIFDMT